MTRPGVAVGGMRLWRARAVGALTIGVAGVTLASWSGPGASAVGAVRLARPPVV